MGWRLGWIGEVRVMASSSGTNGGRIAAVRMTANARGCGMYACSLRSILLASLLASALPAVSQPDIGQTAHRIVEQTNAFRRSQSLANVTPNAELTQAAVDFAAFMARSDRYGHEADGRQPAERAEASGYAACIVSENIANAHSSSEFGTQALADGVVGGWRQSPGHRRNMLDPDVVDIGVAVAHSADSGRYYAVQMFGRPKAMQITFSVSNRVGAEVRYRVNQQSFALAPRSTRTHRLCRSARMALRLPGQAEPAVVQPGDGDRYVVEAAAPGTYRLTKP